MQSQPAASGNRRLHHCLRAIALAIAPVSIPTRLAGCIVEVQLKITCTRPCGLAVSKVHLMPACHVPQGFAAMILCLQHECQLYGSPVTHACPGVHVGLLHSQVTNLDDMRRFILEHSDFSRAQGNVTKHVNIVTQLSEVVGQRHLMDVSTVSRSRKRSAAVSWCGLCIGVTWLSRLTICSSGLVMACSGTHGHMKPATGIH